MRNALLPPMNSPLYNFGNSEVQIPNLDVSMSMDSKINFHGGSFYLDPKIFSDDDNQLQKGEFGFPYQSFINYAPVTGYQSPSSACENISQQSTMLCRNVSVDPWVEMDFQARQMRKRTIGEVNCLFPDEGINDVVGNGTESGEWKKSKRKKGTSSEDQKWRRLVKESKTIPEPKVAVRRSQRLSDRITALQKLVSPYGKTDTSAVLQEAVLYIKLLQEQIQNLYQTERSSYGSHVTAALHQSQEIGGEVKDLRSRGLCLVPVSLTQNVALQEADNVDPNAYIRNTILAGEF